MKRAVFAVGLAIVLSACGGQSGGSSGPSDDVVRASLRGVEVMGNLGGGMANFLAIKNIRHGEPLEANGNGGIPAGTILYPIKVDASDGSEAVFAFYQDSFGEWKTHQME